MELMLQKLGLQQLFFAAIATLTSIVIFLFTNIATLMTVGTLTTITMTNAMQAATAFLIYNQLTIEMRARDLSRRLCNIGDCGNNQG